MRQKCKTQIDTEVMSKVVNGQLFITIGVSRLSHEMKEGLHLGTDIKIVDEFEFANAIARELFRIQPEDGKTLVHSALYKAAERAVENGCKGVKRA